MRKRTYLALALAGLLAFSPAMSQVSIASESEEAVAVVSEEENGTVSGSDATVSGSDATVSGGDGTVSGGDGTVSGGDATVSGSDATVSDGDAGGTGQEDTDGSGQDNQGGSTEGGEQEGSGTEENIQLPVPTGLRWGNNWTAEWDPYEGELPEEISFRLEVYKDGEYYPAGGTFGAGDGGWIQWYRISEHMEDSGTYKFRLNTYVWTDDHQIIDGEWSDWSEEKIYVRPQQQLGTVVGHWSDKEKGVFLIPVLDGVYYHVQVYFTPQGSDDETRIEGSVAWCDADDEYSSDTEKFGRRDYNYLISTYGAGKYRVKIQLYSEDIDTIANGVLGEFSEYYDTFQTAESVSGLLSDAVTNSATKKDALEAVKENIDQRSLLTAMQTDDTVLNQMKDLESGYIAEQGVTVETPTVSAEASAYVDASDISMVGAGLNAAAGNQVALEVSVPDVKENIPGQYKANSVQLDIRLIRDGESVHQLDIPIAITMPVPAGINLSRLVILHYHEDGTFETVPLKNNGDGTITFTVDRFSTFAFAETVTDDSANSGNTGSGDTDSGNTDGGNNAGSTESGDAGNANISSSSNSNTLQENIINVDWSLVSNIISTAQQDGKENAVVLAGTRYTVPTSVINMLAGRNTALMLHGGNGLAVSIQGRDVNNVASDLRIDFSFADVIPDSVSRQVTDNAILSRAFSMKEKNILPFKVDLHFSFGSENAGKFATLYYYDELSGTMQYAGSYRITDTGQAMFAVNRGDEYIVVVAGQAPKNQPLGNYIVVAGDTLIGIARKNGISLREIIMANPQIINPNRIYPGQAIMVP